MTSTKTIDTVSKANHTFYLPEADISFVKHLAKIKSKELGVKVSVNQAMQIIIQSYRNEK